MPRSNFRSIAGLVRLQRAVPRPGSLPRLFVEDRAKSGRELAEWLVQLPAYREVPCPIWGPWAAELDGAVYPCCCPECQAPLSVRHWLERADCWSCGQSLQLRLCELAWAGLERARLSSEIDSGAASDRTTSPSTLVSDATTLAAPSVSKSPVKDSARGDAEPAARPGRHVFPRFRRRRSFAALPAWVGSLLFHLLLLSLLALLTLQRAPKNPSITLALEVGEEDRAGDRESLWTIDDVRFDLPLPEDQIPDNPRQRAALIAANQAARRLRLDPLDPAPNLPDLQRVKQAATAVDVHRRSLVMRDPRLRVQLIRQEGGTTLTEAAVARGLQWLAKEQLGDGSWAVRGRQHRMAATSLALLPFLGAGQTQRSGLYQEEVSAGLRYLLQRQQEDGDLRGDSPTQFGMYVHGQATIVLCEAFAMTGDERLRQAAQAGVDFIVAAQHPRGGWRYEPGQAGDTSVLGWQLMALQSARAGGLDVPAETWDLADQFLESVQSDRGASYSYQPRYDPTHVMTAEALLCRMYLGWTLSDPGLSRGIRRLEREFPPRLNDPDYYYWYYATQVAHHAGGQLWQRWNKQMRETLVRLQRTQGQMAGSWEPRGPHANVGGRVYVTALAICTLEVYYRHAPIFRQIELQ